MGNTGKPASTAQRTKPQGTGIWWGRDFWGEDLVRQFRYAPTSVHFGNLGTSPKVRWATFFTLEPMIIQERYHVMVLHDGWTVDTKGRTLSAGVEQGVESRRTTM